MIPQSPTGHCSRDRGAVAGEAQVRERTASHKLHVAQEQAQQASADESESAQVSASVLGNDPDTCKALKSKINRYLSETTDTEF